MSSILTTIATTCWPDTPLRRRGRLLTNGERAVSDYPVYSEGIMWDGAVILKNGAPMRIDEVVSELNKLQSAIKKQATSALAGIEAAKNVSSLRLQEANRLMAEANPDAIASERQANEILTEENERLLSRIEELERLATDSKLSTSVSPQQIDKSAVIAAIEALPRYDYVRHQYDSSLDPAKDGDYLKAEDVIAKLKEVLNAS